MVDEQPISGWLRWPLHERARLRTWLPVVLLLTFWMTSMFPYADIEKEYYSDDGSHEGGWEVELYDNYTIVNTKGFDLLDGDGNVSHDFDNEYAQGYKELNPELLISDTDNDGEFGKLADMGEDFAFWAGWFVPLTIILLVGMLDRTRPNGLSLRWPKVTEYVLSATGIILALVLIMGIANIGSLGDGAHEVLGLSSEDASNSMFGSWRGEDDFRGEIVDVEASWGPATAWWLMLLVALPASLLLGGLHFIETLPKIGGIKVTPAWKFGPKYCTLSKSCRANILAGGDDILNERVVSEKVPVKLGKMLDWVIPAGAVITLLLLFTSLFVAWFEVDQVWHINQGDEPVQEFNYQWDIDAWGVEYTNHTALFMQTNADLDNSTTNITEVSFEDDTDFDAIGTEVVDMRWPVLMAIFALITGVLASGLIPKLTEWVGGDRRGWWMFTFLVTWLILAVTIGATQTDLGEAMSEDMSDIAPGENTWFSYSGHYSDPITGYERGGSGLHRVETMWGPGPAMTLVAWSSTLLFGLLLLSATSLLPNLFSDEEEKEVSTQQTEEFAPWLEVENWNRPVGFGLIALMVVFLLLGSGVGNALSGFAGSEVAQRKYRVMFDQTDNFTQDQRQVNDGESMGVAAIPAIMEVENVTQLDVRVSCNDGNEGGPPPFDQPDLYDITITPPETYIPQDPDQELTYTGLQCDGLPWEDSFRTLHQMSNYEEVEASSAQVAEDKWKNWTATDIWLVEVTVQTQDGIFTDDQAGVTIELSLYGYKGEAERISSD